MNVTAGKRMPRAGSAVLLAGVLLGWMPVPAAEPAGPPRTLPQVAPVAAVAHGADADGDAPRRASLEILTTLPAGEPIPAPPMDTVPFVAQSIAAAIGSESETQPTAAPDYPHRPNGNGGNTHAAPSPPEESNRTTGAPAGVGLTSRRLPPPVARRAAGKNSSGTMATAVTAGLFAFAGLTLLTVWSRRTRERRLTSFSAGASPSNTAAELPAAPAAAALDELINDALPLVEEEPAFPSNLSFHGRTVGFRYLLLSGPHELRGPHFIAGQISPRLRERAGRDAAHTVSQSPGPATAALSDERPTRAEDEEGAPTDVVQPEPDVRAAGSHRRVPSPLERALLAQRRRTAP